MSTDNQTPTKAATGPRVTLADVHAAIRSAHFFTALQGARMDVLDAIQGDSLTHMSPPLEPTLGLLTFCVLVLHNGFTVTGESYCLSPENFDAAEGRRLARENAMDKVYFVLGYRHKEIRYQMTQPPQAPT